MLLNKVNGVAWRLACVVAAGCAEVGEGLPIRGKQPYRSAVAWS